MRTPHADNPIPLSPSEFYILLGLAKSQNNGYGLIAISQADSLGSVTLTSGALYPALQRLSRLAYVEAIGTSKTYRLTATGRLILGFELDRYAAGAQIGRDRLAVV